MGTLKVGRYELDKLLGEGGMGSVFEATSLDTGERVAVKLINGDVATHSTVLARFEIEAKAAAAIQSPHIAKVLDFGRENGAPYLVMELLTGRDLETLFAEKRVLPPDLVVRFALQACVGLARAHALGIIHRDIKPGNLFLADAPGSDEVVLKVLDFGIAKVRADEWQALSEEPLTRTGSLLGSPRYMSPEQARGYKTIDQRSDLFSLGVVMYQALTGHTPHHKVEAMGDLIVTLCSDPAPPLGASAPWVDARLELIVKKALAIQVADRYATAEEMAKDLEPLTKGRPRIERSLLRTFEPPPPESAADTEKSPPPLSSLDAAGPPAVAEATAAPREPIGRSKAMPAPPAPTTKSPESERGDGEPIPLTWVAAGILLSLVVGIGGVAAGVIPLPSGGGSAASGSAAPSAEIAVAKTAEPTRSSAPGPAPAPSTAAQPTSQPAPSESAASPSASASASAPRPALTGKMPVASSAPPSLTSIYESAPAPKPSAVATPTPPPTPAPTPEDNPL